MTKSSIKLIILSFLLLSCEDTDEKSGEIIKTSERGSVISEDIPEQFTPRCENEIINEICVMPIYPNPMADFTNFEIDSRYTGNINLRVFKNNKEVFTVYNDMFPAGRNLFEIANFDENGNELSSGLYELRYEVQLVNGFRYEGYGLFQIE